MPELPEHLRGTPAGGGRVSRQVLESHQRERVIALVTPVFARRGYQATTVDDLLAAGKVGVGNFYSLFKGKEDCFLAAFDQIVARARERIRAARSPAESWAEEAFFGLRELLSLVVADQLVARVVLIEAQAASPEARRRYEALLDTATGWLEAGRVGMADPQALPPTFERSAIAGLAYYLQQCLFGGAVPDLEELLDEVSSLLLAPLIGTAELRRLRGAPVGV